MEKYIAQLLDDIKAAMRLPESCGAISPIQSLEAHFEEIERWLAGEKPKHDLSYYCGLKPEQFPAPEKLTVKQLKQVNKAFRELLGSWNLLHDIPPKLPPAMAYPLFVSILDHPVEIFEGGGFYGIELCKYDPACCPFGDYCTCKQFSLEEEEDDCSDKDNLVPDKK